MSDRNESGSNGDCIIPDVSRDVELMEMGPLLEDAEEDRRIAAEDLETTHTDQIHGEMEEVPHSGGGDMEEVLHTGEGGDGVESVPHRGAGAFVHRVWESRWRVLPFHLLPDWLKDNDYLLHGHRPPLPSFRACFQSIFRIHTETGNIWTHLLGLIFFVCLGLLTMLRPNSSFTAPVQEKLVMGTFFLGVVLCLSFSWIFHTVNCHSEPVSRTFAKLDYSGIALLTMGSFVPLLYYSFYCSPGPQVIYLVLVCVLGIAAIIVSQCDRFATPRHRITRAIVFIGLGLSGIVPTVHYIMKEDLVQVTLGQMSWFYVMGAIYIGGATLYAARIPERFLRGKCDIWFHSHQIFHLLVIAAACLHFYGVLNLQEFHYRLRGACTLPANSTTDNYSMAFQLVAESTIV